MRTSDRILMDTSPLDFTTSQVTASPSLLRSCLSNFLFSFQLGLFGEISWRRERCFSRNGHSEVDVTFQRGPGSQTEELCALLFPFTSSSNALEDELSCHRLAAGGGFGRPAPYLVHYIYCEELHHLPLPAARMLATLSGAVTACPPVRELQLCVLGATETHRLRNIVHTTYVERHTETSFFAPTP